MTLSARSAISYIELYHARLVPCNSGARILCALQEKFMKKRAVPAPTSELLCKVKLLGARCTIFHAITYMAKKRLPEGSRRDAWLTAQR